MTANNLASANALIAELGLLLNLPGLKLNEHGVACLVADKTFSVNIEYAESDSVLHVYSKVLELSGPIDDYIPLCKKILAVNAYGNQTGGSWLALDESHHEIILCSRIDMDICSADYLKNKLEGFMDQVEHWITKINESNGSEGESSSAASTAQANKSISTTINMLKG